MTTNPLRTLEACGQSVWLDSISRQIIDSGTLRRLIDEDGISGVTANPTIFEKAIAGTHDYDQAIAQIGSRAERCSPIQIYEALAVQDVGKAADLFRPIYEKSNRHDGFVSIEVSPELASDTKGTVSEACRFWGELHRPNILIKVPATQEGIPAIEQLIAEGINVNITLIFAVEVYQ
ncbi:MAG: transaldolase, partial [Chloroflexota bacterium]|nr:transaldolase [Chloroflexota bacterium]